MSSWDDLATIQTAKLLFADIILFFFFKLCVIAVFVSQLWEKINNFTVNFPM